MRTPQFKRGKFNRWSDMQESARATPRRLGDIPNTQTVRFGVETPQSVEIQSAISPQLPTNARALVLLVAWVQFGEKGEQAGDKPPSAPTVPAQHAPTSESDSDGAGRLGGHGIKIQGEIPLVKQGPLGRGVWGGGK